MTVHSSDAAAAYQRAVQTQVPAGPGAQGGAERGDFAEALREATAGAVDVLRRGEAESFKAAAGEADLTDVVTAVSRAEITLQTVVALRDRVIQAYQEILRMPI